VNLVNTLFAACTLMLGIILWITVSGEKRFALRILALGLGISFLPMGFGAMTELLSKPKPVSLEWLQRSAVEAKVHGSIARENEAIYVWLQLPDDKEPRAYVLPWSEAAAIEMHKAKSQADAQGTQLMMKVPFKSRNKQQADTQFYPAPQPKAPPKQIVTDDVMVLPDLTPSD